MDTRSGNDLEQGYQASLQDLEKGFQGSQPASPLKPQVQPAAKPEVGSMGIPADIQQRFEQPFGKAVGSIPILGKVLGPGSAPASLAVPGAGSLLARIGLQGLAGGAEALASGKGPLAAGKAAALGAGGGLAGEAAGKVVSSAASPLLKRAVDSQAASKVADYLKKNVPAWSGMSNLGQMLYSQKGYTQLHEAYDQALKDVVSKGTGKTVSIPIEAAQKLGVRASGNPLDALSPVAREALQRAGRLPGGGMPGQAEVDAASLAKAMAGKWKGSTASAYRAAANALDAAGIGDPAARQAYKIAMGAQNYLNASKALGKSGRDFDLMAAQSKLGDKKAVDELRRRGMGEMIDLLLPEGQKAIKKGSQKIPGAVLGSASGALGGHGLGLPGIGGGGLVGEFLGQRVGQMLPKYTNLPPTPQAMALRALLSKLGGVAGTKGPLAP